MASQEQTHDPVSTFIAVMIAVVSVFAAIGAWRVALAISYAEAADTQGLLAAVDQQEVLATAQTLISGRLFTYARAVADDAIAKAFTPAAQDLSDQALKARLTQEADNNTYAARQLRFAIPPQYIDRDQHYDDQRDFGESVANLMLERDTFPDPHFARADDQRTKAGWLLLFIVTLGVSFVFFTLADTTKTPLRYALISLAILLVIVAVAGGVAIEIRYPLV